MKRGNEVVIAGRRQNVLDEVVLANPGMRAMVLDIADAEDIKRFAERVKRELPKLNVVIQNAGLMKNEDLLKDGPEVAEATITTNLLGADEADGGADAAAEGAAAGGNPDGDIGGLRLCLWR